jgi:hypothetical protein
MRPARLPCNLPRLVPESRSSNSPRLDPLSSFIRDRAERHRARARTGSSFDSSASARAESAAAPAAPAASPAGGIGRRSRRCGSRPDVAPMRARKNISDHRRMNYRVIGDANKGSGFFSWHRTHNHGRLGSPWRFLRPMARHKDRLTRAKRPRVAWLFSLSLHFWYPSCGLGSLTPHHNDSTHQRSGRSLFTVRRAAGPSKNG